jgi:hypothetical protein
MSVPLAIDIDYIINFAFIRVILHAVYTIYLGSFII